MARPIRYNHNRANHVANQAHVPELERSGMTRSWPRPTSAARGGYTLGASAAQRAKNISSNPDRCYLAGAVGFSPSGVP